MLKARIITAIVLLVLFGLDLFLASIDLFAVTLAIIVAAGAWEWSRLSGVASENARRGYALLLFLATLGCLYAPPSVGFIRSALALGFLFWLAVPILFRTRPVLDPIKRAQPALLAAGLLVFTVAALAIQYLRSHAELASPWLLLYAFSIIWLMDIGAYFTGRRFGRRKLSPAISPGKTWEGVWGGLVVTGVTMIGVLLAFDWPEGFGLRIVLATTLAAAASVIGDLYESRIKRGAGLKDSSQLLPGHGGVLDRIDGVLAAMPVFAFVWAVA